ncbi:MAG: hypothetical protein ABIR36_07545 [Nitrospiraceae bacterium]
MMNSGTVSRDRRGSYGQPSQRSCPLLQMKKLPHERSQPGILIFSYEKHLLYMNRRAIELTGHLDPTEIGPGNDFPLESIQEFRVMIQQSLDQRKKSGMWGSFESEGTVFDVACKFLIRGFGIPNQDSYDHSRIVIVLDEVGSQRTDTSRQSPDGHSSILYAVP